MFVLLRCFAEMVDDESRNRSTIAELLVELYKLQPKLGYFLLYYLRARYSIERALDQYWVDLSSNAYCSSFYSKASETKYDSYRELCQAREAEVSACLLEDLRLCAEDDVNLLCAMAGDVFQRFAEESRNNSQLLHLYASHVDGSQLYSLLVQCLHGSLVLFNRDASIVDSLTASLEWETFEQMALWQLVAAHSIPLPLLMPLLPKLKVLLLMFSLF